MVVSVFENLYISPAPDFLNPLNPEIEIIKFLNSGIEIVISLRPEEPLERLYKIYELSFHNIPIYDFDIPEKRQYVYDFVKIIESNRGKKVLTHCTAGRGRSGMMAALYLVYKGFTPDDAIKYVREKIPGAIETLEQEDYIKHFTF